MNLIILFTFAETITALVPRVQLYKTESRRTKLLRAGLWSKHLKQKNLFRTARKIDSEAVVAQQVNFFSIISFLYISYYNHFIIILFKPTKSDLVERL